MAQGPTPVEQRRLRAELRRMRDDARQTQKMVADKLGWSTSKVIRIETGAVNVSTSDVMALLHHYRITDPERTEDLLAITRGRGVAWWDKYSDVYGQQFLNFLGYEDSASRIRQFMGFVVPGLLQTKEYARALFEAYYPTEQARVDRAITVRMQRQEILAHENAPRLSFVLDEAVIHRWIGGADIMLGQLSRIKELAKRPNISIRILPFSAGVNRAMRGSFTIFEFPSEPEDYVVNLEDPHRDVLIKDDPEVSSDYLESFDELREVASPKEKLDSIIDQIVKQMNLKAKT